MKRIICKRCGKEFEAENGYFKFCNGCKSIMNKEFHNRCKEKRANKKQKKLLEGEENIDYVIDMWNGLPTTRIPGQWMKNHHPDRTIEEYISEFPDAKLI